MKLHCFSNLHPFILVAYYFFLLVSVFYFNNPIFIAAVFFDIIALNYFCGCITEMLSFMKYLFFFGLLMLASNLLFMQPINIFSVGNFFSFSSASILFLSFNKIVDSGKFLYVCNKISPQLGLIMNICARYIFILQKRIQEFIYVYSLNTNEKKKLDKTICLIKKIFDWSMNDCLEMITILKSKNYSETATHYKIYTIGKIDLFYLYMIFFLVASIFFCRGNFFVLSTSFIFYLFIPFIRDFFCYIRFLLRGGK